ncbi:glycoside hydrolase family 76 protein [Paenibacillus sp. GCM10012307]|uniref:Glycosyl hydrolase n=1 Tax=Paenibacillus roseus TaxID=2798579 RepID=A0A934J507_9BACL|nr:glycoside hydrolase family 76 protein [Paenibacillus roseus]MBJ6362985.1 glycosyl hydrolase [Paenibacillus roseus]
MNQLGQSWSERAEQAQAALERHYWNGDIRMYNIETPCPNGACNTIFHYWWMAHAVEALVDGLERTGETHYSQRLSELFDGLLERNGGSWPNELYDDMEWMAIGWLRAFAVTGEEKYKKAVLELWTDIQTGWNDHMGGGIAWQKSQLDYKNTPANAPGVILAARLYRQFGNQEDLEWAKRIYRWLKDNLVDPESGFAWDGMNRLGDGAIDKDWAFTYCQGVVIGAAHELYTITKEAAYGEDIARTSAAAIARLVDPTSGLLPDEGPGDAGLFKGILVRYAALAALDSSLQLQNLTELVQINAQALWSQGRLADNTLFGTGWGSAPEGIVQLGTQISGVILLEMAAKLEAAAEQR